jgi:hypothetical protein
MNDTPDELLQQDWTGDCYGAAINWIRVVKERDWVVVHGTVLSLKAGKRINHAWCERGEMVVDLAMPTGVKVVKGRRYYRVLKPKVSNTYSSEDALILSLKHRHYGPWHESEPPKK